MDAKVCPVFQYCVTDVSGNNAPQRYLFILGDLLKENPMRLFMLCVVYTISFSQILQTGLLDAQTNSTEFVSEPQNMIESDILYRDILSAQKQNLAGLWKSGIRLHFTFGGDLNLNKRAILERIEQHAEYWQNVKNIPEETRSNKLTVIKKQREFYGDIPDPINEWRHTEVFANESGFCVRKSPGFSHGHYSFPKEYEAFAGAQFVYESYYKNHGTDKIIQTLFKPKNPSPECAYVVSRQPLFEYHGKSVKSRASPLLSGFNSPLTIPFDKECEAFVPFDWLITNWADDQSISKKVFNGPGDQMTVVFCSNWSKESKSNRGSRMVVTTRVDPSAGYLPTHLLGFREYQSHPDDTHKFVTQAFLRINFKNSRLDDKNYYCKEVNSELYAYMPKIPVELSLQSDREIQKWLVEKSDGKLEDYRLQQQSLVKVLKLEKWKANTKNPFEPKCPSNARFLDKTTGETRLQSGAVERLRLDLELGDDGSEVGIQHQSTWKLPLAIWASVVFLGFLVFRLSQKAS